MLLPGPGGDPVGGVFVLSPDAEPNWLIGCVRPGAEQLNRLAGSCTGVVAGRVELERLTDEGVWEVLDLAHRTAEPGRAAFRDWVARAAASHPSDSVREAIRGFAAPNTAN